MGLAAGFAFTSPVLSTVPNVASGVCASATGTLKSSSPATKKRSPAGVASSEDSSVMPAVPGTANSCTRLPSAWSKWAISMPVPSLCATKSWPSALSVEVSANEVLARFSPGTALTGPKTSASSPTSVPLGSPTGAPSARRRMCTTPSARPVRDALVGAAARRQRRLDRAVGRLPHGDERRDAGVDGLAAGAAGVAAVARPVRRVRRGRGARKDHADEQRGAHEGVTGGGLHRCLHQTHRPKVAPARVPMDERT